MRISSGQEGCHHRYHSQDALWYKWVHMHFKYRIALNIHPWWSSGRKLTTCSVSLQQHNTCCNVRLHREGYWPCSAYHGLELSHRTHNYTSKTHDDSWSLFFGHSSFCITLHRGSQGNWRSEDSNLLFWSALLQRRREIISAQLLTIRGSSPGIRHNS